MSGALAGLTIIEIASIGPGPFAGMMLADHGAHVVRIDRPGIMPAGPADILGRSRSTLAVNLKSAAGVALVAELAEKADGLIEGFRPGVMERLGLGPERLHAANPRLVYGRMTGWGQDGPKAPLAGHDINYIALSGALHGFGHAGGKPVPPVNLVGDFGGGGMLLAFGMLAGILSARSTGQGQVIDCAMNEGAALLSAMTWGFYAQGLWRDERGVNTLDTGAPFYDTYETSDGRYIALGAIEPQFYRLFRERTGLADDPAFDMQFDQPAWPALKEKLAALFRQRTRAEWCALMEDSDACLAPVLSLQEAPLHPHNQARDVFVSVDGVTQPAPAPRFSQTPAPPPVAPSGTDHRTVLARLGVAPERIEALLQSGSIG